MTKTKIDWENDKQDRNSTPIYRSCILKPNLSQSWNKHCYKHENYFWVFQFNIILTKIIPVLRVLSARIFSAAKIKIKNYGCDNWL